MASILKQNFDLIKQYLEHPDIVPQIRGSKNISVQLEIKEDDVEYSENGFKIFNKWFFKETIVFTNINFRKGIQFKNCEFRKGIVFINCKTDSYPEDQELNNYSIVFRNCKGNEIRLLHCNLNRGFRIDEESNFDKFIIKHNFKSTIGNPGIQVNQSEIGNIDFNNLTSDGIKIHYSKISKQLQIENTNSDISFFNSIFEKSVHFWRLKSRNLTFNKNIFNDRFTIMLCDIGFISTIEDEYNKEFLFKVLDPPNEGAGSLKDLYIRACNFKEKFELQGNNSELKKCRINFSPQLSGIINLENFQVCETNLIGVNENAKLKFKNIEFNNLNFLDFINHSSLNFFSCKASKKHDDSSLFVIDSTLGTTNFNFFDFESFQKIKISNSSIQNIITSNIKWFDDKALIHLEEETDRTEAFQNQRDVNRQIKLALRNNGNQIESLEFQAREMKAYRNELKSSENYNFKDKLMMMVGMTNNYGLDWFKPVWQILLITIIFYFIIILIFLKSDLYNLGSTKNFLSNYFYLLWQEKQIVFQLLNPVRRIERVYGNHLPDIIYVFDYLHRLVLGIYIFQIIKAFRKFSLKN